MTMESVLWVIGFAVVGVCLLLAAAYWVNGLIEKLSCEPEVWW